MTTTHELNRPRSLFDDLTDLSELSDLSELDELTEWDDPAPLEHTAGAHRAADPDPGLAPTVGILIRGRRERSERRQRRRLVAGTVVTAAVASVAAVALVVVSVDHGRPAHDGIHASRADLGARAVAAPAPAMPPTEAARRALVTWMQESVSVRAVVAADAASVTALRNAGFLFAYPFDGLTPKSLGGMNYVFDVDGTEAGGVRSIAVERSVPLAVVGPAATPSAVRQMMPDAGTAAARAGALDAQRSGAQRLLRDPALDLSGSARTVLTAGALDLRAQSVLGTLAAGGPVAVGDVVRDALERRAGQPARSLVVRVERPIAAQRVLAALSGPTRPDSMRVVGPRAYRLTWRPAIAPVTRVGG